MAGESGVVKDCGWMSPLQVPKQLCSTLTAEGSGVRGCRGGETPPSYDELCIRTRIIGKQSIGKKLSIDDGYFRNRRVMGGPEVFILQ